MTDLGWYAPKKKWNEIVEDDALWAEAEAIQEKQLAAAKAVIGTWLAAQASSMSPARISEIRHKLETLTFTNRGDVYFMQSAPGGCIKIGSSHDVRKRLSTLHSRGGQGHLQCLTIFQCGGSGLERFLHRMFRKEREDGEWFRETPELLALIAAFTELEKSQQ